MGLYYDRCERGREGGGGCCAAGNAAFCTGLGRSCFPAPVPQPATQTTPRAHMIAPRRQHTHACARDACACMPYCLPYCLSYCTRAYLAACRHAVGGPVLCGIFVLHSMPRTAAQVAALHLPGACLADCANTARAYTWGGGGGGGGRVWAEHVLLQHLQLHATRRKKLERQNDCA